MMKYIFSMVLLSVAVTGCSSDTVRQLPVNCPPGQVIDVYSKSPTHRQCVDVKQVNQ